MPKKAIIQPLDAQTLEYRPPKYQQENHHMEDQVNHLKTEISGLQHAVRVTNEQLTQAVNLMGQMRVELDNQKGDMQSFRMAVNDFASYVKTRQ